MNNQIVLEMLPSTRFISPGKDYTISKGITCYPSKQDCGKYDERVNPSNMNEFAHGAFRYLHKLIPGTINLLNENLSVNQSYLLSDFGSAKTHILDKYYDHLLRGCLRDPVSNTDYTTEVGVCNQIDFVY